MRWRRRRQHWSTTAIQNEVEFSWRFIAHVQPPATDPANPRGLVFYLGPNHYPAGLYLPKGYNLEARPGDDPGWTVIRARDTLTEQVLTMWAAEGTLDEPAGGVRMQDGEQ